MEKIIWSNKGISFSDLQKSDLCYTSAQDKRNHLIDKLSSLDDDLADIILNAGCFEAVSKEQLQESIRKITISKVLISKFVSFILFRSVALNYMV